MTKIPTKQDLRTAKALQNAKSPAYDELKRQLIACQDSRKPLQQERDEAVSEVKALRHQVDEQQRFIAERDEKIAQLEAAAIECKTEHERLLGVVADLEAKIAGLS